MGFLSTDFQSPWLRPPTHPSPFRSYGLGRGLKWRGRPMGIEGPVVIQRSNTPGFLSTDVSSPCGRLPTTPPYALETGMGRGGCLTQVLKAQSIQPSLEGPGFPRIRRHECQDKLPPDQPRTTRHIELHLSFPSTAGSCSQPFICLLID